MAGSSDAGLPDVTAEFTVEPFTAGGPGPHVQAAIDSCSNAGLSIEVAPFGTRVFGRDDAAMTAIGDLTWAAFAAGASQVSLQVRRREP